MATFPSIRIEGGLLGPDVLDQLLAAELAGQKPADFGLDGRRNLTDEIAAVFADVRALWGVFGNRLARLPQDDVATSVTRDAWVVPFLGLLGYEVRYNPRAYDVDGLSFAVSHRAGEAEDAPPIHIVGARQELGRVPASGRPRLAPHSLVQEYLNRTEHLWGLVTNGGTLRLLRDCTFVRRQAYVDFDLQAIIEEQRFQDFAVLYRLLHRSRLPRGLADADECLLETYYTHSVEQGGRVREHLRDGVEECLTRLANGFLHHPANEGLRSRVSPTCTGNERITPEDLYRQLLRLVYRFLFLLVSEDRGLVSADPIYREYYGIARLRRLLENRAAYTAHDDLWQSLRVIWLALADEKFAGSLGLAPLNGELFAGQALDECTVANQGLLEAFWHLAWYQERPSSPPRRVNYAALDVEELGSVYEGLLEFHPIVEMGSSGQPVFRLLFGSERKTTGSYYTPPQLVNELVQSALEPVIRERLAARPKDPEKALLSIRVCDPAAGSGHFLLAAARRLGKELARSRTGEDEPAPERVREAIRDVISHCIYGVDRNPLAVDLCRVALWLESHTGDKPLTFLDHRIRGGDSLVGVFNLESLKGGIPDKAFEPVGDDNKAAARELARRNRDERAGEQDLFAWDPRTALPHLTQQSQELGAIADDSPEEIQRKKRLYEQSHADPAWQRQHDACDLWAAAFFQELTPTTRGITSGVLANHIAGRPADPRIVAAAQVLSLRHRFFHWPLEFPEVFADRGFDVILGNPPWEKLTIGDEEWFAVWVPEIAGTKGKARRDKLIRELEVTNPAIHSLYRDAKRTQEASAKILSCDAGTFPLTGFRELNTYHLFTELAAALVAPTGRVGVIVKTGIGSAENCLPLFKALTDANQLVSLYDFVNRKPLFPAVQTVERFSLLTFTGRAGHGDPIQFATLCQDVPDLARPGRVYSLSPEDIALMSPTNGACPLLKGERDAEIMRELYRNFPILGASDPRRPNEFWNVEYVRIFDMANDSGDFKKLEELEAMGLTPAADRRVRAGGEEYWPLYEGKYIFLFDHRYGSFETVPTARKYGRKAEAPSPTLSQLQDPNYEILPRYWFPRTRWLGRAGQRRLRTDYHFVFRDVAGVYPDLRTAIGAIAPAVPAGDKSPCLTLADWPEPASHARAILAFAGLFASIPFDYLVRNKLFSKSLKWNTLGQIPMPPPKIVVPLAGEDHTPRACMVKAGLELAFTTWALLPLGRALGYERPFVYDPERRFFLLRLIDALSARFFSLSREEFAHVLSTFETLGDWERRTHAEYRTARVALEMFDAIEASQKRGEPCPAFLDPRPADPSCTHAGPAPHEVVEP